MSGATEPRSSRSSIYFLHKPHQPIMPDLATTSVLVVLSTAPTPQAARQLAQTLVQERHAACCTILPAAGSVYRWEGKVEESEEAIVLIKTTHQQYPQLQQRIKELHPYQLPEIIAVPVVAGLTGYLEWVADSVGD
jgi:periplasmic divalent cation tolerance protein